MTGPRSPGARPEIVMRKRTDTAALDAEEWAAEVYASTVRRVRHLATSDADRSGPLTA
jgi:hypothetical protein